MNNTQAFKQAHSLAKQCHVAGESYQVTFGACLKLVRAQAKAAADDAFQSVAVAVEPKAAMVWVESRDLGNFVFGAALSVILAPFFAVMFTMMACAVAQLFGIDPNVKGVWAFFSGFLAVAGVMVSYADAKEGRYQYVT